MPYDNNTKTTKTSQSIRADLIGVFAVCFHVHVKMQSVFRYSHNEIKLQEKKITCRACLKPNYEDTIGFFLWQGISIQKKAKEEETQVMGEWGHS